MSEKMLGKKVRKVSKDIFLGKEVKEVKQSKWNLVKDSIMTIAPKALKRVFEATVREGEYGKYLLILLDEGTKYVSFTLDKKCRIPAETEVDPASIMVYDLEDADGETITRAFAKKA